MGLFKHMTDYSFQDKVVLVTGASRGIGKAIAAAFAEYGAQVIANYNSSEKDATAFMNDCNQRGFKIDIFKADVSNSQEVENMIDSIVRKYKKLDILVNNAGIRRDNFLAMMSNDDWDSVININLKSVYNVTKWVSRVMISQRSGKIINVSSISALRGVSGQSNYAASKGGMLSFTKSVARELGKYNVQINSVIPGFIKTDMLTGLKDKHIEDLTANIALGRFGDPEDVAGSVLFLASNHAKYITGQSIVVDGGLST
jgi:3-oxoacyl-[acyl-carrier protein] reductase